MAIYAKCCFSLNRVFKKVFIGLLFLIVSFTLAACSVGIGTGGGAKATDQFLKGAVIKGFPPVPAYKNAKIIESFGSKAGWGASFVTSDSVSSVVNYYNSALPQLGWQSSLVIKDQANYAFDIKNPNYIGNIIMNTASDGKQTAITISIATR